MSRVYRTFGFMHTNGELEFSCFTEDEITRGELRANIDDMKEEGYTFMGEEVKNE